MASGNINAMIIICKAKRQELLTFYASSFQVRYLLALQGGIGFLNSPLAPIVMTIGNMEGWLMNFPIGENWPMGSSWVLDIFTMPVTLSPPMTEYLCFVFRNSGHSLSKSAVISEKIKDTQGQFNL